MNSIPRTIGQTAIHFASNVFSAVFGLVNFIVFTRLFAPTEFGNYVLGLGFATTVSGLLTYWLRLHIQREQARDDGTDVRGIVVAGLLAACLISPLTYPAALLAGLQPEVATAGVGLAIAIGLFETGLELLRARLQAFTMMKATIARAVLVPALGISFALVNSTGVLLLVSSALAYLIAAFAFVHHTWSGTVIKFDGARLLSLAWAGLPLTLSVTLLSISSVIDRFIIANLADAAHAGQYAAGVDLVRQALVIPAISAATASVPLAIQILANNGVEAVRKHLDHYFELLLAITLPACFGFAAISLHVANVILGPEFRATAIDVMPIVSIAVVFQILTYQYLHVSFLLSNRNSFFLINTGSVVALNAAACYLLISWYGVVGAAWARLFTEAFGFASAVVLAQWAFPVPLPIGRAMRVLSAALIMLGVVAGIDMMLALADKAALAVLITAGIASYLLICWLLDIADARLYATRCWIAVRRTLAPP
jgi:O-antigen/teichoic acid export membrane protein